MKKALLNEPKRTETFFISLAVQYLFAIMSNKTRQKFLGILSAKVCNI